VSEFLKCRCGECGAKYRLPTEYQGRTARCKKCGAKFKVPVPADKTLEDSVLDWLNEADTAADAEDDTVSKPRVISFDAEKAQTSEGSSKMKGPIRIKANAEKPEK